MDPIGPELLTRLLDEHGAALVLFARQWCRTPEDVVQEALLSLVRQSQSPQNVVGWLYRVVRNGAISAGRSESRRSRRETRAAEDAKPWFHPSPEEALDAAAASAAMENLPLRQRETIVARLWGGLSFEQIAELLDTSASSAHRWYQAGLTTLRERLDDSCPNRKNTIKG